MIDGEKSKVVDLLMLLHIVFPLLELKSNQYFYKI